MDVLTAFWRSHIQLRYVAVVATAAVSVAASSTAAVLAGRRERRWHLRHQGVGVLLWSFCFCLLQQSMFWPQGYVCLKHVEPLTRGYNFCYKSSYFAIYFLYSIFETDNYFDVKASPIHSYFHLLKEIIDIYFYIRFASNM